MSNQKIVVEKSENIAWLTAEEVQVITEPKLIAAEDLKEMEL